MKNKLIKIIYETNDRFTKFGKDFGDTYAQTGGMGVPNIPEGSKIPKGYYEGWEARYWLYILIFLAFILYIYDFWGGY